MNFLAPFRQRKELEEQTKVQGKTVMDIQCLIIAKDADEWVTVGRNSVVIQPSSTNLTTLDLPLSPLNPPSIPYPPSAPPTRNQGLPSLSVHRSEGLIDEFDNLMGDHLGKILCCVPSTLRPFYVGRVSVDLNLSRGFSPSSKLTHAIT